MISTLEGIGLPRDQSREALEALLKGERTHATTAFELLQAKHGTRHRTHSTHSAGGGRGAADSAAHHHQPAARAHGTAVGPVRAAAVRPASAHISGAAAAAAANGERAGSTRPPAAPTLLSRA